MEKQRKTKMIIIISLIVAVVGLSVAYAAMTGVLTINGSANVDAANWDIHFANLSYAQTKGEAKEINRPDVAENGASITNINVSLNNPKDEVVYDVDLVNEGSINAEISNIQMPTFTEEQEKYLDFSVTYKNDGTELAIGDLLNKGQTKKVIITIKYRDDLDEEDLPKEKQSITLSYELTYTQTDKEEEVTTPPEEDHEMFIWDSPTIISGLTEYGIEQVKANNGHLEIPEGVTEIAGTSYEEFAQTGTLNTGFSPFAIGKLNVGNEEDSEKVNDPEINIIKSVDFPPTLKKVGDLSFVLCINLTSINLPANLNEIGSMAFASSGITGELKLPSSLITIGFAAFNNTKITGELIIPDSVTTIGGSAFYGTPITLLVLGNGVETIEFSAFQMCENLEGELYIPDSVKNISDQAFSIDSNKNKITSISISKNTQYSFGSFTGRPTPTVRD